MLKGSPLSKSTVSLIVLVILIIVLFLTSYIITRPGYRSSTTGKAAPRVLNILLQKNKAANVYCDGQKLTFYQKSPKTGKLVCEEKVLRPSNIPPRFQNITPTTVITPPLYPPVSDGDPALSVSIYYYESLKDYLVTGDYVDGGLKNYPFIVGVDKTGMEKNIVSHSCADIINSLPTMSKDITMVAYNYEKEYSPADESLDPIVTMQKCSQAVRASGRKYMFIPVWRQWGQWESILNTEILPYIDAVDFQAQSILGSMGVDECVSQIEKHYTMLKGRKPNLLYGVQLWLSREDNTGHGAAEVFARTKDKIDILMLPDMRSNTEIISKATQVICEVYPQRCQ